MKNTPNTKHITTVGWGLRTPTIKIQYHGKAQYSQEKHLHREDTFHKNIK